MFLKLVLLLIIFSIFIYYCCVDQNHKLNYKSNNAHKKYYLCKENSNNNNSIKLFRDVLENNNINQTYQNDWDILLPCKSNYSEKFLKNIKLYNDKQIISFISMNKILGSKQLLWKTLLGVSNNKIASMIMPQSYTFPNDIELFKKNYSKNKYYVLKSEKQRQKGIKIAQNYDEILNYKKNNYKIVQEYVHNSITYLNYKINFRMYLLIICDNNKLEAFMYNDGIISYPKKKYDNINFDSSIASFYTSKILYDNDYPIILSELENVYRRYNWDKIKNIFKSKLELLIQYISPKICSNKLKYNNKTFQLFGVDFIVYQNNHNYDARILEINVGPGMESYCDRDDKMRKAMHDNILLLIGIINKNKVNKKNDFIKLKTMDFNIL